MTNLAPALTQASGIVAAVVATVALVSGFLFSAREIGHRRAPAWWLDFHQGLGGLALGCVGVHVAASLLGTGTGLTIAEALIPSVTKTDRVALAWGILSLYLLAAAVFTTWPRRLKDRRLWRLIHVGSIAGMVVALVHSYEMGSDASRVIFRVGMLALVVPMSYATAVRGIDASIRARARSRP